MSSNPYQAPYNYPAKKQPQWKLAGLGQRFLGAVIDGLAGVVVALPGIILMGLGGALTEDVGERESLNAVGLLGMLLVIAGALAVIGVQFYLLATRSQSIGKYFMKTQIIDIQSGEPAGPLKTILIRLICNSLIAGIPCVGGIYALVDILMIFGSERRCLHDLLAGTVVTEKF